MILLYHCQTIFLLLQTCQAQYNNIYNYYQTFDIKNPIPDTAFPIQYQNNIKMYNPPEENYINSDSEITEVCECSCNGCYNPIACCKKLCEECRAIDSYTPSYVHQVPYYAQPPPNIIHQYAVPVPLVIYLSPPKDTDTTTKIHTLQPSSKSSTPTINTNPKSTPNDETQTTVNKQIIVFERNYSRPARSLTKQYTVKTTTTSNKLNKGIQNTNDTRCNPAESCYSRNWNRKGDPVRLYIESKHGLMPLVHLWSTLEKPIKRTFAPTKKYNTKRKSTSQTKKLSINRVSTASTKEAEIKRKHMVPPSKYKLKALNDKFARKLLNALQNNKVLVLQNNIE